MQKEAQQYLTKETVASTICNAILNFGEAYAIFRTRSIVPTGGPAGLIRDLIGETFLAVGLSSLVPALITRHRRRMETLPTQELNAPRITRNPYLIAIGMGLIATCVLMPLNAWLLPHAFPEGVSRFNVVLYKTLYGTILGGSATFLTVRSAVQIRSNEL
jgi:hypothetical protein